VINAILWKLRTGAPWRDLPERYGPWKTAHERLRKWAADGTWEFNDLAIDGEHLGRSRGGLTDVRGRSTQ
jgi:hypothetical protein